jgi:MFS family permease
VLIDRVSIRWLMGLGLIVVGAGLWGMAHAATITAYIIIFGVTMSVGNCFAGAMISGAVVARWFVDNRALALGIAASGASAGGVLIPWIMKDWIAQQGWQAALENMALVTWLVALPVVLLTIRSWPDAAPLRQDRADHPADNDALWTARQLIRNREFWLLGLALGILFCCYYATVSNQATYAAALGWPEESAATMLATTAIAALVGKLAMGFVADRRGPKFALILTLCASVAGFVILAITPPFAVAIVAVAAMGIAGGGVLPTWTALMVLLFGLRSYGLAMGLLSVVLALCVMPGFPIAGAIYDSTGSLALAMVLFTGLTLSAVVMAVFLRVPVATTGAEAG